MQIINVSEVSGGVIGRGSRQGVTFRLLNLANVAAVVMTKVTTKNVKERNVVRNMNMS